MILNSLYREYELNVLRKHGTIILPVFIAIVMLLLSCFVTKLEQHAEASL